MSSRVKPFALWLITDSHASGSVCLVEPHAYYNTVSDLADAENTCYRQKPVYGRKIRKETKVMNNESFQCLISPKSGRILVCLYPHL